ncbi:LPXTG cell wall anchor domain-containing protein [Neobacillus sp. NPDC058068]
MDSNHGLPSTATTIYNYLLAGGILLLVGARILLFRKRKTYS